MHRQLFRTLFELNNQSINTQGTVCGFEVYRSGLSQANHSKRIDFRRAFIVASPHHNFAPYDDDIGRSIQEVTGDDREQCCARTSIGLPIRSLSKHTKHYGQARLEVRLKRKLKREKIVVN